MGWICPKPLLYSSLFNYQPGMLANVRILAFKTQMEIDFVLFVCCLEKRVRGFFCQKHV